MHTPAAWAIQQFGGVRKLARVVGRSPSSVIRWRDGWRQGDTPGDIPPAIQRRILAAARERKLDVTADDLVEGRASPEPATTGRPARSR